MDDITRDTPGKDNNNYHQTFVITIELSHAVFSYKLATKLKVIKQSLKIWNREVFGSLESNKLAALQQVEYWDQVESERRLTEEEISIKKEAKEGYAKWVNLEEIHWRQLSREL